MVKGALKLSWLRTLLAIYPSIGADCSDLFLKKSLKSLKYARRLFTQEIIKHTSKQDLAHLSWKFLTSSGTEFNKFCPIFEWQKEEPFQKLAAGILASKTSVSFFVCFFFQSDSACCAAFCNYGAFCNKHPNCNKFLISFCNTAAFWNKLPQHVL